MLLPVNYTLNALCGLLERFGDYPDTFTSLPDGVRSRIARNELRTPVRLSPTDDLLPSLVLR